MAVRGAPVAASSSPSTIFRIENPFIYQLSLIPRSKGRMEKNLIPQTSAAEPIFAQTVDGKIFSSPLRVCDEAPQRDAQDQPHKKRRRRNTTRRSNGVRLPTYSVSQSCSTMPSNPAVTKNEGTPLASRSATGQEKHLEIRGTCKFRPLPVFPLATLYPPRSV